MHLAVSIRTPGLGAQMYAISGRSACSTWRAVKQGAHAREYSTSGWSSRIEYSGPNWTAKSGAGRAAVAIVSVTVWRRLGQVAMRCSEDGQPIYTVG